MSPYLTSTFIVTLLLTIVALVQLRVAYKCKNLIKEKDQEIAELRKSLTETTRIKDHYQGCLTKVKKELSDLGMVIQRNFTSKP